MRSKTQLAREAIHFEQERLHENIGSQDQVSVACGGLNRIDFGGPEEFRVSAIILPQERLRLLEDHLMLFYTGIARNASEIAGEQIKVTSQKRRELTEMYDMVAEGSSILVGNGDICDFGRLLNESWQLKRSLTDIITTPLIDDIYQTALVSGAVGGKLLGAGGGGFMLFFVSPERHESVKNALSSFLHVPFRFESSGSQIIYYEPNSRSEF